MITLSIDAMGGDHGLSATVPAAVDLLKVNHDIKLILVGDPVGIREGIAKLKFKEGERLSIQPAAEVVEMHEVPAKVLRSKKKSSMKIGRRIGRTPRLPLPRGRHRCRSG